MPKPPRQHEDFIARYPELAEAWERVREAERSGPLDERTRRLVKLGIAVATRQQGATRSAVRKALAAGLAAPALEQVVALATSTIGFPGAVAAFGWVREALEESGATRARPAGRRSGARR